MSDLPRVASPTPWVRTQHDGAVRLTGHNAAGYDSLIVLSLLDREN